MHRPQAIRLFLAVCLATSFTLGLNPVRSVAGSATPSSVTVTAHVLDPAGKPVSGAVVTVYTWNQGIQSQITSTDAGGGFTIRASINQNTDIVGECFVEAKGYGLSGVFLRDKVGKTIKLGPPLALTGTVTDAAGHPLGGVKMRLESIGSNGDNTVGFPDDKGIASRFSATTDANGKYVIEGLPHDEPCRLLLKDPRFVDERVSTTAGSGDVPTVIAKPCAAIVGRVVYEGGKPAAGMFVSGHYQHVGLDYSSEATTGDDGSYRLTGLPAGTAEISVRTQKDWRTSPQSEWLPSQALNLAIVEGKDNAAPDMVLTKGGIVTGTVVDAVTNAPIAGVIVNGQTNGKEQNLPLSASTTTDAQGNYSLHLWPGHDTVDVMQPPADYIASYDDTEKQLDVVANTSVTVPPIALKHGINMIGAVVDESGNPVVGVSLSPENIPTAWTSRSGTRTTPPTQPAVSSCIASNPEHTR